jgi:hypothetical protein
MRAIAGALAALVLTGMTVTPSGAVEPERAEAVQDCMQFQRQHPHSWGGTQHYSYRACMREHGEPE